MVMTKVGKVPDRIASFYLCVRCAKRLMISFNLPTETDYFKPILQMRKQAQRG